MAFPWPCSCQDDFGIYYAYVALGWNLAQQHVLLETPVIKIAWILPKRLENAHCN